MTDTKELVSVVIPAYNAEETLDETLKSVRNQTYRDLEIIVVDDGSDDSTADVARSHAAGDNRIRIISIKNSGVAHARNVGVTASRGDFIAPIDADDLWHPEKIARQMAVMRAHGSEVGYVYTLYRTIDVDGRVLHSSGMGNYTGHVYLRSLLVNFVGNGSSLLARRAAFDEVGGYEPDLHRQGAQGCEDYLIQILIARSWTVELVPEYLTAYRLRAGAMSSDSERMMRSHLAMLEHVARRFPETPKVDLAVAEASVRARFSIQRLFQRRVSGAAQEFWSAICLSPLCAINVACSYFSSIAIYIIKVRAARFDVLRTAVRIIKRRILKRSTSIAPGVDFFQCDPSAGLELRSDKPLERRLAALAERETFFFQTNRSPTHPQFKTESKTATTAASSASCAS